MQLRMLAAGAMVSAVMGLAEAGVRSSRRRDGFAALRPVGVVGDRAPAR